MSSFCRAICPPATRQPASQKPFILVPGDAPTLRFSLVKPDNSPFNLANYTVDFFIKRSAQDSAEQPEFHGTLGSGVALGGLVQDGLLDVTIPEGVTLALRTHRPYPWYLRISHSITPAKTYIPARGSFLLELSTT